MSKRQLEEQHDDQPPKRPKPDVEEIRSADQLRRILNFNNNDNAIRSGLAALKPFLEKIAYSQPPEEDEVAILREYLDAEQSQSPGGPPLLQQFWDSWQHATADGIVVSLCAALALFMRTLSRVESLREHGYAFARSVLLHPHLRLLQRSLASPRHKQGLISPALRLLTEVVSFDGGMLARGVYKRRELTFDGVVVRRLLTMKVGEGEVETVRRPSVRTLAVRYTLALLRGLNPASRADMLARPLAEAVFRFLPADPVEAVEDVLGTVEKIVLGDGDVSRAAKAAVLTVRNLERATEVATRSPGHPAAEKAMQWLLKVVSRTEYGILRPAPWGSKDAVRNTVLSSWILTLKPHVNPRERDIVVQCFKAAPELVLKYFREKNVQLENKPSETWMNHAAFLYETVRLPLPDGLGSDASMSPSTEIMLESLLPQPLSHKVLTRCLNSSVDVMTWWATRVLVLAIEKLRDLQRELSKASTSEPWTDLYALFAERVPPMKDVIAMFRKVAKTKEESKQREEMLRLLRLYYEVLPILALEEQFDVSAALAVVMDRAGGEDPEGLAEKELQHLLAIAQHNSSMKWLGSHGVLDHSPLVKVLQMHVKDCKKVEVRDLLLQVLQGHHVIVDEVELQALIASCLDEGSFWAFLDDCMARTSKQPVKYLDSLEELSEDQEGPMPGLMLATILEQIPFNLKNEVALEWAVRYMTLLSKLKMAPRTKALAKAALKRAWKMIKKAGLSVRKPSTKDLYEKAEIPPAEQPIFQVQTDTPLRYSAPPEERKNHTELLTWAKKDLDEAFEDGTINALVLCLCSEHHDIRRQGHFQLRRLLVTLRESSLEEKEQLGLLIGELIETYEHHDKSAPLPYFTGCFAGRALEVLREPTHFLYAKVNQFLIRSPAWRNSRLPSHWLRATTLSMPEEDTGYWKEVQWVLEWLLDGLRTAADLDILRRAAAFEKLMTLYLSPAASTKFVKERIMELLYRATCIQEGSMTLVSRASVLAWLEMENQTAMKQHVLDSCDKRRLARWTRVDVT
ncbi:hypothetical protein K470DRAFT_219519 [Piedraia hortae CBS 480.64]|uniref:Nucleolar pre-ribosomal-associated protein 1 C-terminal domain-containing protein n=1 Tax=Piedraia hortae CBS 480.64 TaxID=1314780 RepID=A0A6A7BX43_9PEZI|nr:hypothetical protein K470DRAFT_219519 [Piedraia hortae CBS 480.64]